MKCLICNYEKKGDLSYWENVPVLYQHGPRKGQVKEIRKVLIDPEKDLPDFMEAEVEIRNTRHFDSGYNYYSADMREVDMIFCPKCGYGRLHDRYLHD